MKSRPKRRLSALVRLRQRVLELPEVDVPVAPVVPVLLLEEDEDGAL